MKGIKITAVTLYILSASVYASSDNEAGSLTIGAGADYAPEYIGSDKYDLDVMPYFEWTYGDLFINSEKGVGFTHQFDNGAYVGQSVGYSLGRVDNSNSWLRDGSDKLKGMGKIKSAMTTTTTLGWWISPWIGFEGNIIAPLTDSQGMQYNAKANWLLLDNDADTVMLSTGVWYGDSRFNNTWFGVNEAQSSRSAYSAYTAGSGVNRYDYSISWQHAFSSSWSGYAEARYSVLESRVSHSPIVREKNPVVMTLGVFYSF
ncbi:MAG: MipA/OmpV family protein [Kluyvera sp.]|uniref:MipA/OmpV family protein n=1 Tax=Kluyvera sp. TaxID=1538228 RepID=UPI003F31BDA2